MKLGKTLRTLWYYKNKPRQFIKRAYYQKTLKYPSGITLIVSKYCNSKCGFCFVRDWVNQGFERNMTLDEFKVAIDKTAFFNPTYSLFGGEPLLNKELPKIMEHIRIRKCEAVIFTNAALINDEIAQNLAKSNLLSINVSLDGFRETHNKSRGVPIFDNAYDGLKLVRYYLNKYNNKKTKIRVICTFTEGFNDKDYEFITGLKSENIVDFVNFGHLMFDKNIDETILKNYMKLEKYFNYAKGVYDHYTPQNMTKEDIKLWYSKRELPDNWTCDPSGIDILPDGSVTICYQDDKILGNILKQDFRQIWSNPLKDEMIKNKTTFKKRCFRCPVRLPRSE